MSSSQLPPESFRVADEWRLPSYNVEDERWPMKQTSPSRQGRQQQSSSLGDPNPNLYIHNVPKDATEEELRDLFSTFGNVERIRLKINQKIGPQALYAFVTFGTTHEAQLALERLNGFDMRSRKLRIEFQRSRIGGGGGGGGDDHGSHFDGFSEGNTEGGSGGGSTSAGHRDRSTSRSTGDPQRQRKRPVGSSGQFSQQSFDMGRHLTPDGSSELNNSRANDRFEGDWNPSFKRPRYFDGADDRRGGPVEPAVQRQRVGSFNGAQAPPQDAARNWDWPGSGGAQSVDDGSTAYAQPFSSFRNAGAFAAPASEEKQQQQQQQQVPMHTETPAPVAVPQVLSSESAVAPTSSFYASSDRPADVLQGGAEYSYQGGRREIQAPAPPPSYQEASSAPFREAPPPGYIQRPQQHFEPSAVPQKNGPGGIPGFAQPSNPQFGGPVVGEVGRPPPSEEAAGSSAVEVDSNVCIEGRWFANLARNGKRKVQVEVLPVKGSLSQFLNVENSLFNISHRSSWEDAAKKSYTVVCLIKPALVEPNENNKQLVDVSNQKKDATLKGFQNHVQYLLEKERAGVVTFNDKKQLFIIPSGVPTFESLLKGNGGEALLLTSPPSECAMLGLFVPSMPAATMVADTSSSIPVIWS